MKKRIVFPLFLLLLAGGTAAAQNWQEALKQAATAVGDKATDGKLTQYALPGTWTYSAPGVRFEGEEAAADLGAALLVPAISEQLAKLYLAVLGDVIDGLDAAHALLPWLFAGCGLAFRPA